MKKLLTLLSCFLFMLLSSDLKAQNQDNPWLIGFGTHFVDYTSTDPIFDGWQDFNDWNGVPAVSRFNVGRSLNNSFALDLAFSIGSITVRPGYSGSSSFGDVDLSLKYLFANGYLLKTDCWFDPYVLVAPGLGMYGSNSSFVLNAGAGFNMWASENFGFYFQTVLNKASEDVVGDYFQQSVGFVFRFGQGKDTDKDGIIDKKDKCPTVAGLEKLNGCPDKDGDGITDSEDFCPEIAGLMYMHGCPDMDGDSITDNNDECPTQKGLALNKGCPDRDSDGIVDKNDSCPDIKGLPQFYGCIDTDGDGVADNRDKCPTVFGIEANNGCPMIPTINKEAILKISFAAKAIQFETGKDVIKKTSYSKLDTVVTVMNDYKSTSWMIEGHTDNTGNAVKNLDLSKRRAAAVKKYFVDKGIEESRLTSEGYGDTKPAADNKTSKGRAENRRVEIKLVE